MDTRTDTHGHIQTDTHKYTGRQTDGWTQTYMAIDRETNRQRQADRNKLCSYLWFCVSISVSSCVSVSVSLCVSWSLLVDRQLVPFTRTASAFDLAVLFAPENLDVLL